MLYLFLGIEVSTEGATRSFKAAMVALSCDLPARALLLNMKQFNGQHGCHLCEDPGKTSALNPLFRWWPYNNASVKRTKQSLTANSVEATLKQDTVSYKGVCVLCDCYLYFSARV